MKIVFFDIGGDDKNFMGKHFPDAIFLKSGITDVAVIPQDIEDAEIISVFTISRLTKNVLEKFKNLKMVALRSVGYSHVDIDYCKLHGIKVANTPHYGDNTVAEFAMGLLLAVTRKIGIANKDFENGTISDRRYTGIELFGKTVGVIGAGAIGKQFIRIAKGFSMNVLGYDPYPDKNLDIEYTTLDELLTRSDVISIHAPSTKENYHLLDKNEFAKMKDGVIIINTARGELIDSLALYEAIANKKVAGAGLDVIEGEEIVGYEDDYIATMNTMDRELLKEYMLTQKLLKEPNVIITPHIAYDTKEATQRILDITLDNINGFLNNSGTRYIV